MLVEKGTTPQESRAATEDAMEKQTIAVECDENDISLQPSPLALLLRHQWASEALTIVKEEESVARLDLMQLYHSGFLAIVRQSLFILSQDSTAIATLQPRHCLATNLPHTLRPATLEGNRGLRGSSGSTDSHGDGSSSTELANLSGWGRGVDSVLATECSEEDMAVRHLQRVRSNQLRRIAQGLREKRHQVNAFAEREVRRMEAALRRARALSSKASKRDSLHPSILETRPKQMQAEQQVNMQEARRNFAHAHALQFLEERNRRRCSVLQLERKLWDLLEESRAAFKKEIHELQSTAAHVHEMHREGRVMDVRAAVKELQRDLHAIPEDSMACCGTKEARMRGQGRPSLGKGTTGTAAALGAPRVPLSSSTCASSPWSASRKFSSSHHKRKKCVAPVRHEEYLRWCGAKETAAQMRSALSSTGTCGTTNVDGKFSADYSPYAYNCLIKWR